MFWSFQTHKKVIILSFQYIEICIILLTYEEVCEGKVSMLVCSHFFEILWMTMNHKFWQWLGSNYLPQPVNTVLLKRGTLVCLATWCCCPDTQYNEWLVRSNHESSKSKPFGIIVANNVLISLKSPQTEMKTLLAMPIRLQTSSMSHF